MRRIYNTVAIIFVALLFATAMQAAAVSVTLVDGVDSETLKAKMQQSLSTILTEVNSAQAAGRSLDFHTMGLNSRVSESMAMLWEVSPFECTDEEITEHVLRTGNGYQVRNIPLMMRPMKSDEFNEEEYQEAVVDFDNAGNVESFHLSISMNLYQKVIKSNLQLTDLRRRQLILDYVEQFRTAYNQKDIKFLGQVFSDDALIITGRVIMQKHQEGYTTQKISYYKQGKAEYLKRLKGSFDRKKYIRVTFDEIEVMRHPTNSNFYGVTLHQGYTSDNYHDDGYLFLLWDFTDETRPQVHVRTWQPDRLNGKSLDKDELFSLSDFDIDS